MPIAIGLLVMMYPVLAKVRYNETGRVLADKKLMVTSLVINWILAPAFMFVLAWIFLAELPEYRTGLIIVGLARCIAMVFIWNDLACGDREAAAVLVAINSVFQVIAFGALGWFYLQVLPSWLGLETISAQFSIAAITVSVLVFLGIPLVAGYLTRTLGEKAKGRDWYEGKFLPKIGPWALYGLLFTIVLLFALQGDNIISKPLDVLRMAIPLLVYFVVVFGAGMLIGHWLEAGVPAHHHPGLHRGREQLRAGHCGGHRHLRRHQRTGPGRRGRPADRGADPGRLGLCRPVGPEILPRIQHRHNFCLRKITMTATEKPSVLFVCVHNAGRSQMAAAFLSHLSEGRIEVRSAGSAPADSVNPAAVEAMKEVGIDMSAEIPKVLTTEAVQDSDVVITMGCGDACPFFPGKRYEDWKLEDPAGQGIDGVRPIRDEIRTRIEQLIAELLPAS